MKGSGIKKVAVTAIAALAVAAGGTAFAAGGSSGTGPSAMVDAVAQKLGISSAALKQAMQSAATDRVDAQLASGAITQAQADAIKARIASGDVPGLRGPGGRGPGVHRGMGGPGGHMADAAAYLGLTRAQLAKELRSGATLSDVAKAQGKTVDGLEAALVASEKKEIAAAVADGRLTQAQADRILEGIADRVDAIVTGKAPKGGHRPGGHGFGPPPPGLGQLDPSSGDDAPA